MILLGVFLIGIVFSVTAAPQYDYLAPSASSTNSFGKISNGASSINLVSGGNIENLSDIVGIGGISSSSSGGKRISNNNNNGFNRIAPKTIYHKQIFVHSAPDDQIDSASLHNADALTQRKNIRIIFIKNPENKDFENAALQLTKSAIQDKTAIYVLNKQTDINELQNKLNQIQDSVAAKPEVHFVKYKTPEESEFAQQRIASQYDNLGGPTQVANEVVAPVENFVGILNSSSGSSSSQLIGINTSQQGAATEGQENIAPQQSYLPPTTYLPAS